MKKMFLKAENVEIITYLKTNLVRNFETLFFSFLYILLVGIH